ncbi:hypothetical protein Bca52824_000706 [Brassica carinata]|uniref:Uncharacterized protein n=1 Tax=Brassica carinata TaxID=52824 RepID=A0A8X7WH44_BRACI|nr:hypothetical protein Bca52824_000706 [Brassica carinata]
MTSIFQVSIYGNSLEGEIPNDITKTWNGVVFLDISINKFSGVFPPPIYNFSSLQYLSISDNYFTGRLRPDFGELLPNLLELNMGRNLLIGSIPTTLTNISTLQRLAMDNNTLTGSIPPSFGKLRNLQYIALRDNSLGSRSFGDLEFLDGLSNCTELEVLTVSGNRLGGTLDLSSNSLSGGIPSSIRNNTRLDTLNLFSNRFEGIIPQSLGNCTSLRFLGIGSNRLDGPIPWEIMRIQSLVEIDMSEVGLKCSEESPANRLAASEATKELISIRERFFKAGRTARR